MEIIGILLLAVIIIGGFRLLRRQSTGADLLSRTVDAFRLGDGEKGEVLFDELLASLEGYRERLKAAQGLMEARAYEHALVIVDRVLQTRPDDEKFRRLEARLHGKLVREDGVELLEDWVEAHPGDGECLLELASLLLRLRRLDEAIDYLEPYVESYPRELEARSLLGRAFFHAGELELAREHLAEALAIRDLHRRQAVPLYDNGMETGYDFRCAVEGRWEEEQDAMLLEQIESGAATSKIAHHEGEIAAADPEAATSKLDQREGEPAVAKSSLGQK